MSVPSSRGKKTQKIVMAMFRVMAWIIILMAAMIPVAYLIRLLDRVHPIDPALLIVLLPGAYVLWLICLMILFSILLAPARFFFPKPRFLEVSWDRRSLMAMGAVGVSYQVQSLLLTLPLAPVFATMPFLRSIYWRAYSKGPKAGNNFVCYGMLTDPDLVEVGNEVVIGSNATLNAHAFITRKGNFTYVSGPIKIGSRVTIGANTSIGMYTTIEDDSMVLSQARVPKNTTVGRGEIWGGSPAKFVRMAEGFEHLEKDREEKGSGTAQASPDEDPHRDVTMT